ncbi:D-alanine aminotransferase [wastewater metagenome]|uniref:D-alanine aminotransferase n=3 Tax=root TaxID=1 RepID=A0A5B8RB41_9ZZZZ|nr:D-alanine aminotransferase [uncultured organism]
MTAGDAPCYLNGEWLVLSEARVSPMDRGYLFGDGVYEVIPAYSGRAFLLERHIARLRDSLAAIGLDAGTLAPEAVVSGLLEGAEVDCSVYLQITRGVAPHRDHRFPAQPEPGVFAYRAPMPPPVVEGTDGVAVILREDIRWARCDIKAVSLLGNVLLRQAAEEAGAFETLLQRGGRITEASASNLFAVIGGTVVTPPLGPSLLPGVTRAFILELARGIGLPVAEQPIEVDGIAAAEEVWLTSSTREIVPVTQIDGASVGDGSPGPVWRRLREAFDRHKAAFRVAAATEVPA